MHVLKWFSLRHTDLLSGTPRYQYMYQQIGGVTIALIYSLARLLTIPEPGVFVPKVRTYSNFIYKRSWYCIINTNTVDRNIASSSSTT